ncbi:MAG: hypothetical protein D6E12_16570 [Desulfovibrio sp.]|nr:MAG: hypothetical protein D6E12_16570 [Desulfovibrio sp.]
MKLRTVLILLLLIVALIYGASWFLTSKEKDLSPESLAWLQAPEESTLSPARNAHYYLLGFRAPAASDPVTLGQEISNVNHQRMAEGDFTASFSNQLVDTPFLAYNGDLLLLDMDVIANADFIEQARERNALLLERYETLLAYTSFEPGKDNLCIVHDTEDLLACRNLYLVSAKLKAAQGQGVQAIEDVARDSAFWRMATAQSNMFLFKILGKDTALTDMVVVVDILGQHPELAHDTRAMELIMDITAPASPEELDWTPVYVQRFRDFVSIAASPPPYENFGEFEELRDKAFSSSLIYSALKPLYSPEATINDLQKLFACRAQASTLPPAELESAFAACEQGLAENSAWSLDSLTNPLGRRLLLLASDNYLGHLKEFHMRYTVVPRIVRVWAKALAADIREEGFQDYLNGLPLEEQDPFTHAPFHYETLQQAVYGSDVIVPITWPDPDLTPDTPDDPDQAETPQQ